jgi:nicotinamidase-related amidase
MPTSNLSEGIDEMNKLEKWRGYVPDDELANFAKGSFANRLGIGERPALLNIDSTRMFVDPEFPQCGAKEMPELIAAMVRITEVFRRLSLPIYYSRRDDRSHPTRRGMWNLKLANADSFLYAEDPRADEWPPEYAPRKEDVIVYKNKPSAFFGTNLASWLHYDQVDTVVMVGLSTSGCVRQAAVDAFSHNFRVTVVEEACGDRSMTAHRANLFDIDMKFGDVEKLDDVISELERRFKPAKRMHAVP